MGADSKIEWCRHTFNAWEGCEKVSPGCKFCYASERDKRWHGGEHWGKDAPRFLHTDSYWRHPIKWNRDALAAGERHRVFCSSLADVFEDRRDLDPLRQRLWSLIEATPALDWLLLTKRPQNMERLAPERWSNCWPFNVWAGATAEDQEHYDERWPVLARVPTAVHFLSCEPLLGSVSLRCAACAGSVRSHLSQGSVMLPGIRLRTSFRRGAGTTATDPTECPGVFPSWCIVGGESGPGARAFDLEWARDLVFDCGIARTACFIKQLGAQPIDESMPLSLKDRKGGDIAEFPCELRARQFPITETTHA